MDFKKILGEEIAGKLEEHKMLSSVIEKLESAKLIQNDSGEFIPQSKFSDKVNTLNAQIETLTDQLTERDKDVEKLQKSIQTGGDAAEELEKMKSKHKDDTEALQNQLQNLKMRSAIELALRDAKIRKPVWAKHLCDEIMAHSDKFVEIDGKYSGLEDVVKGYKDSEDYKDWFGEVKINGRVPGESGDDDDKALLFEGKKASELTFTDKLVLKNQFPEKYKKMFPI